MKPLSLQIKGLNSFEDEQDIDFTALTRFGMFGVFGPTGSGKSTIFDAMTLALYGVLPRHGRDSFRECMNPAVDEMAVRFRFALFSDIYVAERRYRLRKDKLEPLAKLYRECENGGEVLTDKPAHMTREVTELLGLGYSDFSRAVVLPQGRFAEFLLLENKEKRDMLERIFGLESYGEVLNRRINNACREQSARLEVLDSSLAIYGDVSAERLTEARAEQQTAETRLRELKERIAQEAAVVKDCEAFARLLAEREDALSLRAQYQAEAHIQNDRLARMARAHSAALIGPYITDYRRVSAEADACAAALNEKKTALARCAAEEKTAAAKLEQAQAQKDTAYIALTAREARLEQAAGLWDELTGITSEHARLRTDYRQSLTALTQRKAARAELLSAMEADARQLEEVLRKRQAAVVTAEQRSVVDTARGLAQELQSLDARVAVAEKATQRLRQQVVAEQAKQTALSQRAEDASARAAKAERELTTEQQRNMAYTLAQTLKPGQPCPVCGATEHPAAPDHPVAAHGISAVVDGFAERETALHALKAEADGLRLDAARLAAGICRDQDALVEQETALTELQAAQAAVRARLTACGFAPEEVAPACERLAERDSYREKCEQTEMRYRQAQERRQRDADEAVAELTRLEAALSALEASGHEKRAGMERLTARIRELTADDPLPNDADIPDSRALSELLSQTRAAAQRIQSALTAAKTEWERLSETRRGLSDVCFGLSARQDALITQREGLYGSILGLLSEHGYNTMDEVEPLSAEEKERLAAEIAAYERRLAACEENLARLHAALAAYDVGELPAAASAAEQAAYESAALTTLTDEAESAAQTAAVLAERVSRTEASLKETDKLKQERQTVAHRADLLTDLGRLFAGNQFVEYIAGRQLRYIAAEASARLKTMTAGRYALELTDRADFVIRDDHNGGVRRSPRTLSGGETFIASLCLALALSSRIQLKGRSRLEFFFLDEGFGSLDPAALDTVVSALERLRQEHMTVGVISHVDELKNRMPVKLLVTPAKPGVCGSRVRLEL